jgi:putative addiction module component (TIGR02574 family)
VRRETESLLDVATIFGQIRAMSKNSHFDFSQLTSAERLALAQDLWDSVEDAAGVDVLPLTDEQRAELDLRLADLESNPDDGIPWEQAKGEILDELKNENRHRRGA